MALAAVLVLTGCGGRKSQVMPEEAVNFASYRRIGILAFADKNGKGQTVGGIVVMRAGENSTAICGQF